MIVLMRTASLIMLITLFTGSCSVISQQVRTESMPPPINYKILVQGTDNYIGDTVILGGYILETKNLADESIIKVLQAPLVFREEPKSKDHSEGRFIISRFSILRYVWEKPLIFSTTEPATVPATVILRSLL